MSALPQLHPHQLALCLLVLAIIVVVNLRGVKETGFVFMVPTFLFVGTLAITIVVGVFRAITEHGAPVPVTAPPPPVASSEHLVGFALVWLLLKAFSNGCAAMTGVEAVSNGVTAFKEPRSHKANQTLTVIIAILIMLLAGLAYVAKAYHITAMDPNDPQYQSVLSIQVAAVFGRRWFYFLTMGSVLAALSFSANTAFADFPRMARAIAIKDFLPHVFILRGRRLLFSHGIYALTGFTALILIIFDGVTDRLIPLYAIGAFLAFTLSQAGMVKHWMKTADAPHRQLKLFLNGLGAVATGITLVVVLVTKFTSGAWITVLLVPGIILTMYSIKRHYSRVHMETADPSPMRLTGLEKPIVVVPVARWDKISEKALRFALVMSDEVKVVNVESDSEPLDRDIWERMVMQPIREHGMSTPELVSVSSNFRTILGPLMDYILQLEDDNPGRKVAILLPELVVRHWWENLLHNQRVQLLKLLLLLRGNQRIVVVNIPWYL